MVAAEAALQSSHPAVCAPGRTTPHTGLLLLHQHRERALAWAGTGQGARAGREKVQRQQNRTWQT